MKLFKHPLNLYQKSAFISSVLLCLLCIAWEWFLAPLRPHGSFMVLNCLPIVFLLPGLYRGANYQLQALSMVILLYYLEGISRLFEKGLNPWLASIELFLCSVIFFAVLKYLGPIKKAARAKKDEMTLSTTDQPK
jgi:uncharacterized membrane protein